MDLTTRAADTHSRSSQTVSVPSEVDTMFKDSFSEGGIYPLRALLMVAFVATAIIAIAR